MRSQLKSKTRLNHSIPLRLLACTVLIVGGGFFTAAAYILTQQRVTTQTNLKFNEITETHLDHLTPHPSSGEVWRHALCDSRAFCRHRR
jgi:hypothetical protein